MGAFKLKRQCILRVGIPFHEHMEFVKKEKNTFWWQQSSQVHFVPEFDVNAQL